MASRSQYDTPDTISGKNNLATPFTDLQPKAQPFSVYEKPVTAPVADAQTHNNYLNLAHALGELEPTLIQGVGYLTDIDDKRQQGEAAAAANKAAQDKNITDIKSAMNAGLLPAGASPIFIKAWKETYLKLRGEQSQTAMKEAYYSNDELRNSDDPEAFNKFATDWRQKFLSEAIGSNQYTGQEVANSKINEQVQSHLMSLHNEHITFRVGERERMGRESAQNLAQSRIDKVFAGDFWNINWDDAGQQVADVWYSKANGLSEAGGFRKSFATADMTDSIIAAAKARGDARILELAKHIKTPGGNLAGTAIWREKAQNAAEHIASEQYQKIMREDSMAKLDVMGSPEERVAYYRKQFEATSNDLYRTKAARDLSSQIYLAPADSPDALAKREKLIQDLIAVDPTVGMSVQNHLMTREEHIENLRRTKTHDLVEADMRKSILDNPMSPDHEDRIISLAKANLIDRDQMRSMLSMVNTYRTAGETHSSLKDPGFTHLEKAAYAGVVKDLAKVGGYEAIMAGKAQWEFRATALQAIVDHPELAKNGPALAEYMEKKLIPITEKYNRLLKPLLTADQKDAEYQKYLEDYAKQYGETVTGKDELGNTVEVGTNPNTAPPRVQQQVKKAEEFKKKLDLFDKGKGPDPRLETLEEDQPKSATKPPKDAKELSERLDSKGKASLRSALDRAFLPGKAEKPITIEALRDLVRETFAPQYGEDLTGLNNAVNEFIATARNSNRYKKK